VWVEIDSQSYGSRSEAEAKFNALTAADAERNGWSNPLVIQES
jgi:hypothetical protein